MPPKKSIFKQPGARHFQLVHRSQRDPLIHDPEASTHVLKPIIKGQSRAILEQTIAPSDLAHDLERANIGEAALYGVYYDDTEYDYMQHLREVGRKEEEGEGVESVLIEASASSTSKKSSLVKKGKGKGRERERNNANIIDLRDPTNDLNLPTESLPSKTELTQDQVYNSQTPIPSEIKGFQPDMNPHLRQTLEALEDDAFVDESLEDAFFAELVGGGEVDADVDADADGLEFEFEFREEGVDDDDDDDDDREEGEDTEREEDAGWEARFAKFKKEHEAKVKKQQQQQHQPNSGDSDDLAASEGGDTIGQLPSISVIGGKKRRKGSSEASGYSMSSSSMFRNEGLTMLDERFDQVEKQYESDSESDSDSDSAPELITSREDFNAIMDDFLQNYEIIGGKMKPILPGETVSEKLGTLRQSLKSGEDEGGGEGGGFDARTLLRFRSEEEEEESDDTFEEFVDDKKDRWDCETILSTYSNLENHPKLIRARDATKAPKIRLDPKTGLPSVKSTLREKPHISLDEDLLATRPPRVTTTRKKGETKEEKRSRKQAAKEERQERRSEKKATQTKFANERKQQLTSLSNSKKGVRKL